MFKQEWAARARVLSLCAVMTAALVGCGGDGDSGPVPITISAQPSDQNAVDASAVTFTVAAAGDGITYQWQQSTDGGTTWTNIAGATSASYTINSVTVTLSGEKLRVVVAGTASTVTSSAVTLTVSAPTPAAITVQPTPQTATAGSNATFTVTSTGTAVTYQWQSSADGATWTDISGQTSATLTLAAVALADNGKQIRVLARNSLGTVTSSAVVLTVQSAPASPVVSTQPVASSVVVSGTATFSVVSSGTPTPTYQWQFSADNGVSYVDIAGATASSYTTAATTAADDGKLFRVTMTNSAGTVVSDAVRLTVAAAPVPVAISAQPVSTSVAAPVTATFSVAATGSPAPTYQWQLSIDGGATFANITGATSASYTTPATATTDTGRQYRVVVTNSQGSVNSAAATLSVVLSQTTASRWLFKAAGPVANSAITWADGVVTHRSQALLAVGAVTPGTPITVAPVAVDVQAAVTVQANISSGGYSDMRVRHALFFAQDGRLYRADGDNAAIPAPVQTSSVQTSALCSFGLDNLVLDLADATRSWLAFTAPGADGLCSTADDNWRAVRVGMTAADAALTLDSRVLQGITDATGALTGAIALRGTQVVRLDANLQNATTLFSVDSATFKDLGMWGGEAAGGLWLFRDGNQVWGVDLLNPGVRVSVATLSADEVQANSLFVAGSANDVYLAINGSAAARVVRLNSASPSTPPTALTPLSAKVNWLGATASRVVVSTDSLTLQSLPKGGAVSWTVLTSRGVDPRAINVAGESVWVSFIDYVLGSPTSYAFSVDGGASTPMSGGVMDVLITPQVSFPASSSSEQGVLVLQQGVASSTLALYDANTRGLLRILGTFPASTSGFVDLGWIHHFGQSSLVSYAATDTAGDLANSDLYFFRADTTGQLTKVTDYLGTTSAASSKVRALSASQASSVRRTQPKFSGIKRWMR